MNATLFGEHIAKLLSNYEIALQRSNSNGSSAQAVLVHSGSEQTYFADDRHVNFQPFGHFNHWLPISRPDQFIWFEPGRKPVYLQVIPDDFWYEQAVVNEAWWADQFEIVRLGQLSDMPAQFGSKPFAYLGENTKLASEWGVDAAAINPPRLLAYLDFHRAVKSGYELEQLRHASRIAMQGHRAARECFLNGGNEYAIHTAYLLACEILELETPYTNIVALDEKAAILHYQNKRRNNASTSKVLLIDAGYRHNSYCSDITRTSVKESVHPVFQSLLAGMEALVHSLVASLKPKMAYQDLHTLTLRGVANLLIEHGICQGTVDALCEQNIPQWFMPHGVGHLLGIQVHDVGGHQRDEEGSRLDPPANSPHLRNTRTLDEDMVFTVEPGLYFIPSILEKKRNLEVGSLIDWPLVDALYPCGGIRIEDNVRLTGDAPENLTRQFET